MKSMIENVYRYHLDGIQDEISYKCDHSVIEMVISVFRRNLNLEIIWDNIEENLHDR